MHRRRLLAGAVALPALAATAGCTGLAHLLTPVEDHEFTAYQPATGAFDRAPGPDEEPEIEFDADASRVVVTGSLFVGSSSCNRAVLEGVRWEADADALRVVVGSGRQPDAGNACTADESADAYRLVVTFDGVLPEAATVREGTGEGATETRAVRPA